MILAVACETCDGIEVGRTDFAEASAFIALLLLSHVDPVHAKSHVLKPRLIIEMNEEAVFAGEGVPLHDVMVTCVGHACKPVTWTRVSMQEATFRLLAYHSNHEGHPLRVDLDGQPIYVPKQRG